MQRGKRAPPKATKEESSSSSSGEEVELDLDESGRVRVDNLTVQPFRSFPNVLTDGTCTGTERALCSALR